VPSFYKDRQGRTRPITQRKRGASYPQIKRITSWGKRHAPEAEIAAGVGVMAAIPLPPGTDPTDVIGAGMVADGLRRKYKQNKKGKRRPQ